MASHPFEHIIAALQTAVSPVILISGLGLLLLTMTNRLGRAIDRARALGSATSAAEPEADRQMEVILVRAKLLRKAILFAVASSLSAAVMIIVMFIMVLLGSNLSGWVGGLFIFCMVTLITSLIYFMRDVNLSLNALLTKLHE